MNFCTKCGAAIKPDARFCGACGEIIEHGHQTYTAETYGNPVTGRPSKPFPESGKEFTMKNSQRRVVNIWLILMVVFVFCMFVPSMVGLDGMDGGFFMSFLSGFFVIMSLIVIFIYRSRAKQLDKILMGDGRIAVWQYSQDEWVRFIASDFEDEKKEKKILFFVVAIIAVVVGVLLLISLQDVLVLFIALGIIPIVAIPAFIAPRYRYNKLKNSEAKALIAEKGVIVGKMFHLWVNLGASLDNVTINSEGNSDMIEFTYSMPTRNGRNTQTARIPIPKGKRNEALWIVEHFSNRVT